MNPIQTPEGAILLRCPTEAEAIAYEDKRRAARRPRAENEQVTGAVYDNGLNELLSAVVEPKREVLDVDDGWLSLYPGVQDRMANEFRRLGGYALDAVDCPDAVSDKLRADFGRRVIGLEYGGQKLAIRRMTYPEYTALAANDDGTNLYKLLAQLARSCVVSHADAGEDRALSRLFEGRPYMAQTLGLKLYELAQGVADAREKKSGNDSSGKIPTSTSQPQASSPGATASAGES